MKIKNMLIADTPGFFYNLKSSSVEQITLYLFLFLLLKRIKKYYERPQISIQKIPMRIMK